MQISGNIVGRTAAKSRYVKLNIATPMCQMHIMCSITIDGRLALASDRKHLYIVSAPEVAPSASFGRKSLIFYILALGFVPIYNFSESSQSLRIKARDFGFRTTAKPCSAGKLSASL
jgi:hypothetical protein